MKAIILNYCIGAVEIAEIPDPTLSELEEDAGLDQGAKIEEYMQDELGINLSEISYMIVGDECPVYPIDKDEPITIL